MPDKPPALTKDERIKMGASWRAVAKHAIRSADRIDPEHATLVLAEVDSMGQVARVITGLKNVLNATQAENQTLKAQVSTLTESVGALQVKLDEAKQGGLDAEDIQALSDASQVVDGISVASVKIE